MFTVLVICFAMSTLLFRAFLVLLYFMFGGPLYTWWISAGLAFAVVGWSFARTYTDHKTMQRPRNDNP